MVCGVEQVLMFSDVYMYYRTMKVKIQYVNSSDALNTII